MAYDSIPTHPARSSASPESVRPTLARWQFGTVTEVEGERYVVSHNGSCTESRRALGCVLVPHVGDTVATLMSDTLCYIVQVLARDTEAPLVWDAPGPLSIKSDEGLALSTDRTLDLSGTSLKGRFEEVNWWSRVMQFSGAELIANSRLVRWIGECAETIADRLLTSARTSVRTIGEAEHLRTGVLNVQVRDVAQVRARHLLMKGKDLAKVDAGQIHLG